MRRSKRVKRAGDRSGEDPSRLTATEWMPLGFEKRIALPVTLDNLTLDNLTREVDHDNNWKWTTFDTVACETGKLDELQAELQNAPRISPKALDARKGGLLYFLDFTLCTHGENHGVGLLQLWWCDNLVYVCVLEPRPTQSLLADAVVAAQSTLSLHSCFQVEVLTLGCDDRDSEDNHCVDIGIACGWFMCHFLPCVLYLIALFVDVFV